MTALRQAAQDQIARTQFRMTIGGAAGRGRRPAYLPLVDPSTEEHLTNVPAASVADVSRAVEAADVAFQSWRQLTDRQRIDYLNAALDIVEEHGDELAMLDAINGGMAFSSIRGDAAAVCEKMRATMFRLTAMRGQVVPGLSDRLHHTVFEPYGVVARITPFNHPLYVTTQCLLPIALGNTVVAKRQTRPHCLDFASASSWRRCFRPVSSTSSVALGRWPAMGWCGTSPCGESHSPVAREWDGTSFVRRLRLASSTFRWSWAARIR